MRRKLFLLLWVFLGAGLRSAQAIEIYANGQAYSSFKAYQDSEAIPVVVGAGVRPSGGTLHELYVLSVERGVADSLRAFYASQGQSDLGLARRISPEELADALRSAVTVSNDPKLLISGQGKIRVMSMGR